MIVMKMHAVEDVNEVAVDDEMDYEDKDGDEVEDEDINHPNLFFKAFQTVLKVTMAEFARVKGVNEDYDDKRIMNMKDKVDIGEFDLEVA